MGLEARVLPDGPLRVERSLRDLYTASLDAPVGRFELER